MANNYEIGKKGEAEAAEYLVSNGYEIMEMNYRSKFGEIDIISRFEHVIVFVEVKKRRSDKYGRGAEAVNYYKQRNFYHTAQWYVGEKRLQGKAFRMDIIEIQGKEIRHIKNAFEG